MFPYLDFFPFLLVAIVAFFASVVGGVAGYGTGLLLPPVLVPLIGAEAVVPVIGLSALMTNFSRLIAFRDQLDWSKASYFAAVAIPTTVAGAYGYTLLSGPAVSILIGAVLIFLVPARYWLRRKSYTLQARGLAVAGVGYGLVVGGTAGSGVVLISILMAAGLGGQAVIATDAAISIIVGIVKSATFAARGALPWDLVGMAVLIGVCATPGAFVAKRLALRLSGQAHILILDAAVICGGALLIWNGLGG